MPKASPNVEPLDQPRETLAAAIARHTAARDNVARVSQPHTDAEQAVYAAADALKNAEAQHDEALACESANLAAAALGEPTGQSVADAEAAVTEATDDLARARATRDALAERAQREASEASRAEGAVNDAIVRVIMAEAAIGDMLAHAQDLQRQLIDARLELRWLQHTNCVPEADEIGVRIFLLDVSLPSGTGGVEFGNWSGAQPATEKWVGAVATLKTDPAAKLPRV